PIKILYFEDSQNDVAFLSAELEKFESAQFNLTHTDELELLEQILGNETFDVILTDFNVPGSTWEEVYTLISKFSQAPIVVVSGSIGEAEAVNLLRANVSDFILKENLEKVPFVLQSAAESFYTKREVAEQKERATKLQQRIQQIGDSIPGAIFQIKMDSDK